MELHKADFAAEYAAMSDERLVRLALTRELVPAAKFALADELRKRRITSAEPFLKDLREDVERHRAMVLKDLRWSLSMVIVRFLIAGFVCVAVWVQALQQKISVPTLAPALITTVLLGAYMHYQWFRWRQFKQRIVEVQQGAPGDGPRPAGSARA